MSVGSLNVPPVKTIPLLNVEVAPEERLIEPPEMVTPDDVARNPGAVNPEYKVEVPDMKFPTDCMERMLPGDVVPMPTLPPLRIEKRVVPICGSAVLDVLSLITKSPITSASLTRAQFLRVEKSVKSRRSINIPVRDRIAPMTSRGSLGSVVPIPTLPFNPSIENIGVAVVDVAIEYALTNCGIVDVADFW